MSTKKFAYGKILPLLVDVSGFPDGRLIQFEIWMKKGQEERQVDLVNGVVRGGKGRAKWTPPQGHHSISLTKGNVEGDREAEEYYFKAKIDELEIKSENFQIMRPLELRVGGRDGRSIDGADYEITFSDGSKNQGRVEGGLIKVEDAPPGKFDVKIERHKLRGEQEG